MKQWIALIGVLLMMLSPALAQEIYPNPETGLLDGAESSWLIENMGTDEEPHYMKIATFALPEGFKDLGGLKSDKREQNFFLVPEDKTHFAETVLVMFMPGQKAADLAASYGDYQEFLMASEPANMTFAGYDVHMRLLLHDEYDYNEMGERTDFLGCYLSLASYTDVKDGAIMIAVFTRSTPSPDTLVGSDEIMAFMDVLYSGLQVEN